MKKIAIVVLGLSLGFGAAQAEVTRPSTNSGCDILQSIARAQTPPSDLGLLTDGRIDNTFANVEGRGVRRVTGSQVNNIATSLRLSETTVRALLTNCRNEAPATLAIRASLETVYAVRVPTRTANILLSNPQVPQINLLVVTFNSTNTFAQQLAALQNTRANSNSTALVTSFLADTRLNTAERTAFLNTIPAITFRSSNR